MRTGFRAVFTSLLVGLISVSAAFAGIVLSPPTPGPTAQDVLGDLIPLRTSGAMAAGDLELSPSEVQGVLDSKVTAPTSANIADGTFLIGASRGSFYPSPTLFGGTTWQTEGCTEIDKGHVDQDHAVASMEDIKGWPAASPDCIYLGGFGIGPARAARSVDPGGVWVRSIAISNGIKTFVYQITDTVGWFARYDQVVCPANNCGILDMRKDIAAATGIAEGDVIIASTHSHATADTYGGWGGIPTWYRKQLRDTTVASAKQAIANLQGATLNYGNLQLRNRNSERRDTYLSNSDTEATWLQAKTLPDANGATSVIATLGNFAGHPTTVGDPILHADWPGAASRRFEAKFGGVGLLFEGGLGNVSTSGAGSGTASQRAEATGIAIGDDISSNIYTQSKTVLSNAMKQATKNLSHPVLTNPGLTTLGTAGFFDREFVPGTPGADGPGVYHWSKPWSAGSVDGQRGAPYKDTNNDGRPDGLNGESVRSCDSAGPVSIKTVAGAHKIGELLIAFAPGEIFSNISEVAKENSNRSGATLVFGQANDALGYIIQSFEYDYQGNVATEYGTTTGEYEEVFAVDHCFGDHVLDTIDVAIRELGLN